MSQLIKYKIVIILLAFSTVSYSQTKLLQKTDSLSGAMKYATAYELLHGSDPNNMDPDISIAKIDLLLKYHIKTELFQRFALKDLQPGQLLDDLRESSNVIHMIEFKPDSILMKLIKQYPGNYKLHKALGNFYYEALLTHPDDAWLLPDSVLIQNIKSYNLEAYKNDVYDYWSLFEIGFAHLMEDEIEPAIPYLEQSIELNPSYALSHYNLAYAFMSLDQSDKALPVAIEAFKIQSNSEYKAEAARLVALLYEELEEADKALEYYRQANKLFPNDYNTVLPLMALECNLNETDCKQHALELFDMDPANAAIYQAVLRVYGENEKEKEFIKIMDELKNKYRPNVAVMANVHLHQAIAQYDIEDRVDAKLNFEKARNLFRNLYAPSHSVFTVIDSYTVAIRKKLNN